MYYRALKLIRQYHRLNQSEVAEALGYSRSYISEIEKEGGKKPSIEILERYAAFFKIPLSSLLVFAEQTKSARDGTDVKFRIADKALSMLEWVQSSER